MHGFRAMNYPAGNSPADPDAGGEQRHGRFDVGDRGVRLSLAGGFAPGHRRLQARNPAGAGSLPSRSSGRRSMPSCPARRYSDRRNVRHSRLRALHRIRAFAQHRTRTRHRPISPGAACSWDGAAGSPQPSAIATGCLAHVFAARSGCRRWWSLRRRLCTAVKWVGADLPLLRGLDDAAVAPGAIRADLLRRSVTARSAVAGVLAGRADQRAQSESGDVLSRLPAAVRRRGCATQAAGIFDARFDLHFQRDAVLPGRCGMAARAARPCAKLRRRDRPGSIAASAHCSSISAVRIAFAQAR